MVIKKRSLEVDGININFYESTPFRSEVPLILLHGGGSDSATLSYGNVMSDLGDVFHVIAPDLPGYGESDKSEAPYTLEWYQKFFGDFVSTLGYGKIDLCGLSLGGGVALGYALKYPERIRKLVLIAPYGLTNKIPHVKLTLWFIKHPHVYDSIIKLITSNKTLLKANLRNLIVNPEVISDELLDQLRFASTGPNVGDAWKTFQMSEIKDSKLRTCYMDNLNELSMPVMLFTGKDDHLVPSKDVEEAAALIKNSELVEFEKCGHWVPRDRENEFLNALINFIK